MEGMPSIDKRESGKAEKGEPFDPFPLISAKEWLKLTGYKLQEGVTLEEAEQYQKKLHDAQYRNYSLATLIGKLDLAISHASPDTKGEMEEKLVQLNAAYEQAQKDYYFGVARKEESRRIYNKGDPEESQKPQDDQNKTDTLLAQIDEALK